MGVFLTDFLGKITLNEEVGPFGRDWRSRRVPSRTGKGLPIKDMTADFFDSLLLLGPSRFDTRGVIKQSAL